MDDDAETHEEHEVNWLNECQVAGNPCVPFNGQDEVDDEAASWAQVWRVGAPPHCHRGLGNCLLSITILLVAAGPRTFSGATGLRWDKLHPMAVTRCLDTVLRELVRLFVWAEVLGAWLEGLGYIVMCLPPKPHGGRRGDDSTLDEG